MDYADLDPETKALCEATIGAPFEVSRCVGHGFLENVYRKSLLGELEDRGVPVEEEVPFSIRFKTRTVGTYFADIVVGRRVIVELKVAEAFADAHVGQVLNYLRVSGLRVGLLFNFGLPKVAFRRVIL
ncbi:GxxExxY protein [Aerophototrophica crusticola]|uniref:GxxExxY protein n=1 Tax=Aerophototrophica crusticola TaxID=1709002 RepID=A0A858RAZ1_9PROT|nr:GxxExxY protein [Rhodospirillaceae bacterium B3]